ncbi:MAG: hypothetical protein JWM36_2451 [Hyphomicrobiales bacterium]|nr:hypothetical protein [Hyphomicrobiales bacterium]
MSLARPPVPGKECGSCTLCCKLPAIAVLNKPRGVWCSHALPGRGCGIYEERPGICRDFHCEWMVNAGLGPEWKPATCKFVMFMAPDGNLSVLADSGYPDAWRNPRYYPWLKTKAARMMEHNKLVVVLAGPDMIVILPSRDERLRVPDGHLVHVTSERTSRGMTYKVSTLPQAAAQPDSDKAHMSSVS